MNVIIIRTIELLIKFMYTHLGPEKSADLVFRVLIWRYALIFGPNRILSSRSTVIQFQLPIPGNVYSYIGLGTIFKSILRYKQGTPMGQGMANLFSSCLSDLSSPVPPLYSHASYNALQIVFVCLQSRKPNSSFSSLSDKTHLSLLGL